MRTVFVALLLAGVAATPALAQEQDDHGPWHHNARNNGGGDHDDGSQGGNHVDRPQFTLPSQQVGHPPPVIVQQGQPSFDRPHFDHPQFSGPPQQTGHHPPVIVQQGQPYRGYQGGFGGPRFGGHDNVTPEQDIRQQPQPQRLGRYGGGFNGGGLPVSVTPRFGTQPPVRGDADRRWAYGGWDRDWRYDRRYDWQRWRERHRSIFHIGIYYDPFGWGYQPFQIGWRLWPVYYGQQYWINDPWDYQLPPPPPGTMWVRYWNDALLVDMYSGEVVDVIYGFFW